MSTSLALVDNRTADLNQENRLIAEAVAILDRRLFSRGPALTSPDEVRQFLKLKLAVQEHEVFGVIFLDSKHRVLAFEELFHGTIDSAAVYPRQVVKRALAHNAAAVILVHNHPSGSTDPSQADRLLTLRLKDALDLVDVRVVDHFIVGRGTPLSLAEYGWI